jgi:DNA (cytosine-5)-methyltransferase 1
LLWRILRSLPEGADVDSAETTHLSFCAGYGGIDLGLQRVLPSCRTVAYVEIEAFAIANLVAKMEAGDLDAAPVWTDIKTFPTEPFRGLVDIISGGYPCQPFSAAGSRLGTKDPRHLWPFLRRAIRVIQPGRVFLENVEGHISLGLSTVISDLEEDGYRATWGIFSAAEVGASHQRKRVFIYGELADTSSARAATWLSESQQRKEGHAEKPDNGGNRRFPARPGQPQFHWEEPRTVADTKSKQSVINAQTKERTGLSKVGESDSRKAEPKLGGATDGCTSTVDATANRVDRLRLLGNGVVPATAAKAWTVLSKRFEHYES